MRRVFFIVITVLFVLSARTVLSEPIRLGLVTFLERPLVDVQNQKPSGLAIELIEALMKRTGYEYTIKFAPPKRSLLIAQRTPNHCVFPIDRSQERETLFQWVSPVLISRHGFYSRPDRKVSLRTLNDARKYVLGSYLGSGVGEYLSSFGFSVDYASRNELNAEKLIRNRIDLWVSDTISARYIAREMKIAISEPELVFYTSVRAMGCNLGVGEQVMSGLQNALLEMYHSGEVNEIYRRFDGALLK